MLIIQQGRAAATYKSGKKIRVFLTDSPRDHAIMHYTVVPLRYFVLRLRFDSKYGVSEELFRSLVVK